MQLVRAEASDDAWRQAFRLVSAASKEKKGQASRGGDTYEMLHVAIEIGDPRQHWVVSRSPAINPAFGIAEVIWMLAGSNDAAILNYWFPKLPEFGGQGPTYAGAYGHRLRHHFGLDQIQRACEVLSANPDSRQVVLQYWDGRVDFPLLSGAPRAPDIPCNVISMLKVRDGKLDWTQVMRSNDVCRGLPYNLLQFTVLQEVLAGWLDLEMGQYCHWSDSLHAYADSIVGFSIAEDVRPFENHDELRTDASEGQRVIEEMYRRMVILAKPGLSAKDVSQVTLASGLPPSYQNLLIVLGADAARRKGYSDEAQSLMALCENHLLSQAWTLWSQRLGFPI